MSTPIIAAQKNSAVSAIFDVRDVNYALMTGQAANLIKTLRDPDSGAAAAETVTIVESGTSGYYRWSFTPAKGGMPPKNYMLQLDEPASSRGQILSWLIQSYDALPAIAGPTANLTTLAAVREALKLPAAATGDDAYLTNLISRISEWVKHSTARSLTQTTITRTFNGTGSSVLDLRDWPIISVTSVHESIDYVFDSTTLIASADYHVNTRKGLIRRLGGVPWLEWGDSIQAIFVAGYAAIPVDLEHRVIQTIVEDWRTRQNEGLSSKTLGDGSVVYFPSSDRFKVLRERFAPYALHEVMA